MIASGCGATQSATHTSLHGSARCAGERYGPDNGRRTTSTHSVSPRQQIGVTSSVRNIWPVGEINTAREEHRVCVRPSLPRTRPSWPTSGGPSESPFGRIASEYGTHRRLGRARLDSPAALVQVVAALHSGVLDKFDGGFLYARFRFVNYGQLRRLGRSTAQVDRPPTRGRSRCSSTSGQSAHSTITCGNASCSTTAAARGPGRRWTCRARSGAVGGGKAAAAGRRLGSTSRWSRAIPCARTGLEGGIHRCQQMGERLHFLEQRFLLLGLREASDGANVGL